LSSPSSSSSSSYSSSSSNRSFPNSRSPGFGKSNISTPRQQPLSAITNTTPQQATDYLSDLLSLPKSKAFPPDLALQILTHKSFRLAHVIRHQEPLIRRRSTATSFSQMQMQTSGRQTEDGHESESDSQTMEEALQSATPHNSRLSFMGRRAIASYLALFVHSSLPNSNTLKDVDFLRGRSLEAKLEAMRHVNNLGREVGGRWGLEEVMRWDRNQVSSCDFCFV
jgi:hypothetical protein